MSLRNDPFPTDLCPEHARIAWRWWMNDYNPQSPNEWPVGMSATRFDHQSAPPLMDSRAMHEERARDFDRKNRSQVELIARICRSGRSPQCTPAHGEETPCD
ncbi:hypothetical protein ACFY1A_17145 [Streptomyces sp. NPDC001520]|uniref:hypothetical protein n=1 Tax=Streptomyces sp. NPDC001520 TaxID=3364581 RepID=UPI00368DCE3E